MSAQDADHTDVDRWLREAGALCQRERLQEALALLDHALRASAAARSSTNIWGMKSTLLRRLGRPQEALGAAERAVSINPDSALALDERAAVLAQLGRYSEALHDSDQAVELAPQEVVGWWTKGQVLRKAGQTEAALAALDRALALDAHASGIWRDKAGILANLGRYREAVVAYNRALRSTSAEDGEFVQILIEQGQALERSGRPKDALAASERACILAPTDVGAWQLASQALVSLRHFEDGLAAAEQALAVAPENALSWSYKGRALYFLDRPHDALEACDAALRLDATCWDAQWWRAVAVAHLHLCGELPPGIDIANEPRLTDPAVWTFVAKMLRWLDQYDEALAACDQVILRDASNLECRVLRSMIYKDQRRYRQAARAYWQALRDTLPP